MANFSDSSTEKIKVLLADDSKDNQFLVRHMLEKAGMEVREASNGEEAMNLALNENFDVVLMDVQMPVMDCCEATQNLRKAGYKKPIVALTAHAMAEERALTQAAGCDGHLTKPINTQELLQTVTTLARWH
jgi:CheY-like chemotaxis protein